jgi:threonyl-tRNA synthetase
LSSRPEEYIGIVELWDEVENILESAIKIFTSKNNVRKKKATVIFMVLKIDIVLMDKFIDNLKTDLKLT